MKFPIAPVGVVVGLGMTYLNSSLPTLISYQVNNFRFPILVSEIMCFSHLELLWSVQTKKELSLSLVRRASNTDIVI